MLIYYHISWCNSNIIQYHSQQFRFLRIIFNYQVWNLEYQGLRRYSCYTYWVLSSLDEIQRFVKVPLTLWSKGSWICNVITFIISTIICVFMRTLSVSRVVLKLKLETIHLFTLLNPRTGGHCTRIPTSVFFKLKQLWSYLGNKLKCDIIHKLYWLC